MKKNINIALAALALIALGTACSKQEPVSEKPVSKTVRISATLSEAATRVSFDPVFNESGKPVAMNHTWEAGDQLKVSDSSDPTVYSIYDLVDGIGNTEGAFEGVYFAAASYEVEVIPNGTFVTGYDQTQDGDGATDHLQFVASASGVQDLSSIDLTETSGIIGIIAKLPAGVAATVDALEIETSVDNFENSTVLTVSLTNQADADNDGILKVYANVPSNWSIPAGAEMFLRFYSTNANHTVYTRYQKFATATAPVAGNFNYMKFNCSHIDQYAGASDAGTAAAPYLVADKYQMLAMRGLMPVNATTYFELLDDIDLAGVAWTPLNNDNNFARGIYLEGNDHTISNLSVSGTAYPSLLGVVNGTVQNLTLDGANITAGGRVAGVLAGYIGSASVSVSGTVSGVNVENSTVTGTANRLGGMAGIVSVSGGIEDCHVLNTTVSSTAERVGGLFGEVVAGNSVSECSAEDVTVSGSINIGGLIGVFYGHATDCFSSGSISSINTTDSADIALGGLVGYMDSGGIISHCASSVEINQTTNGRDIGGFVGRILNGTVEKSYCTGDVKGIQRNVGGFVGLISNTSGAATINDCYCTGNAEATKGYAGGFVGLFEKGAAEITNCYATGEVKGQFALGGLVGVTGSGFEMTHCAAWNSSIIPSNYVSGSWSSGAVIGVTFPTATVSGNYRNPSMALTAWWVPDAGYDHPDVDSTHPLVVKDITTGEMRTTSATSLTKGQDNYPQYAHQGKHVDSGTTLSALASTTLGWSSDVWDFSGEMPTLL